MGNIVEYSLNPLALLDDCSDLLEYPEGDLANHIFSLTDERIMRQQQEMVSAILEVSPAMAELAKGLKKTQHLKLVFSDEIKDKLAKGTYHLMERKECDEIFTAVVVDAKGKTEAIADLKWEDISKGVDVANLLSAMQGMAIQQQLRDIAGQLEEMSESMEDILMGQYNDRLALYYSGESIFREALATNNNELRKQLSAASIMALTDAETSLQTSLTYEVNNLCKKYDSKKGRFIDMSGNKLREKMFLINTAFQTIHKAVTLKASIYYQDGEYRALTTVLDGYKTFLENTLTDENAHILYLADPNEKNMDGTWSIRQNELPQKIESAKLLLSKKENYSLEVGREVIA